MTDFLNISGHRACQGCMIRLVTLDVLQCTGNVGPSIDR